MTGAPRTRNRQRSLLIRLLTHPFLHRAPDHSLLKIAKKGLQVFDLEGRVGDLMLNERFKS